VVYAVPLRYKVIVLLGRSVGYNQLVELVGKQLVRREEKSVLYICCAYLSY